MCLREFRYLPKGSQGLVVYDGEQGIVLDSMKGNWAKSSVDLGCPEIFHIPEVTSVLF